MNNFINRCLPILFLLVLFTTQVSSYSGPNRRSKYGAQPPPVPVEPMEGYQIVEPQQQSTPYTQCGKCRCCAPGNKECVTMNCCYGIKCNLPSKPAGQCFFTPIACGCSSCSP
ncbi:hypothetical protein IFM89_010123 [Coptis chinensis]|uniref:DUF7866 domain-containing protein n=1 Tax=Coptis chinensis TaxID=261450 RepID=A0A835I9E5_9MAGN|nr:hypothetical protein IFM89_010123 [Coptis chinensis]